MEKVLLAIDGVNPNGRAFSYAVELCKRIRAELNVLQVISPRNIAHYLKMVHEGARCAKEYIEGTMVAAAFSEAGEYEAARDLRAQALQKINQLLPQSERVGVPFRVTIKSGRPSNEIICYVEEHRDVVLTIYDRARKENPSCNCVVPDSVVLRKVREQLPIPLVVMRD